MRSKFRARAVWCAGVVVLVVALAVGCTHPTSERGVSKTAVGGVGGATAGGLLGAAIGGNTKSIAAGAVTGAMVGMLAGNVLDQRDRDIAARTAHSAFETSPSGTPVGWNNPDTGNYGQVVPTRTYQAPSGQYCREYTEEIVIDGRRQSAHGTACRMPDGTWRIQP
jgi:surface antigen